MKAEIKKNYDGFAANHGKIGELDRHLCKQLLQIEDCTPLLTIMTSGEGSQMG
jgi:hypothetical protein